MPRHSAPQQPTWLRPRLLVTLVVAAAGLATAIWLPTRNDSADASERNRSARVADPARRPAFADQLRRRVRQHGRPANGRSHEPRRQRARVQREHPQRPPGRRRQAGARRAWRRPLTLGPAADPEIVPARRRRARGPHQGARGRRAASRRSSWSARGRSEPAVNLLADRRRRASSTRTRWAGRPSTLTLTVDGAGYVKIDAAGVRPASRSGWH